VIRVDTVWLAVDPLDMRSGTEAALARVVRVFGAARFCSVIDAGQLNQLDAQQLREMVRSLMGTVTTQQLEIG
jgi:hypothetical protein